jgi:hypothetical protein
MDPVIFLKAAMLTAIVFGPILGAETRPGFRRPDRKPRPGRRPDAAVRLAAVEVRALTGSPAPRGRHERQARTCPGHRQSPLICAGERGPIATISTGRLDPVE